MTPAELLQDHVDRIAEGVDAVLEGLTEDQLAHRPAPDANSIGWLVWHLARVQDDHIAAASGLEEVYSAQGFIERFALPFEPHDIGYGHSSEDVGKVQADGELLAGYLHAVHRQTKRYLATLDPADLDRVVDEHWDPPVTLGTRLVSIINDDTQHVGQAAYVRGMLGV